MQEDLENRSVALTVNASKITARTLAKLMQSALRRMKESRGTPKPGRQSLKQLSKDGTLSSVEITDGNIKAFDPVARKYGIGYDLKKDASSDPPKWVVLFRAKDADAMTAAFREFVSKTVRRETDRPSVRETMRNMREKVAHAVRDIMRHKHRGGPEL
jgi:hypothetical protein